MRKTLIVVPLATVLALFIVPVFAAGGFDQYGYNYQARLFNGKADGVDRILDGMVWGDPTFANDHLVMKWSKAWNDARFNGAPWTPDAWETNEWNGNVPGGSGVMETVKVIWVGPEGESSQYWRPGGYLIWGEFEVIMDHYTGDWEALPASYGITASWMAKAIPNGFGK